MFKRVFRQRLQDCLQAFLVCAVGFFLLDEVAKRSGDRMFLESFRSMVSFDAAFVLFLMMVLLTGFRLILMSPEMDRWFKWTMSGLTLSLGGGASAHVLPVVSSWDAVGGLVFSCLTALFGVLCVAVCDYYFLDAKRRPFITRAILGAAFIVAVASAHLYGVTELVLGLPRQILG